MTPTTIRSALVLALFCVAACGDDSSSDETSTNPTTTDAESSSTADPTVADTSTSLPTDTSTSAGPTDDSTTDPSADSSGSDDGSTTEAVSLEIAGSWADDFGGTHDITETAWVTSFGEDAFPYTITQFDNAMRVVIAQDDVAGTWSKYEWTYVDDALWYCQSSFGLKTEEDAVGAPGADATDPAAGGCGEFSWSALTPA